MLVSSSLEAARTQPYDRLAQSRRSPEVLIIDPDPDSRTILSALLGANGYSTVEAATIDDVRRSTRSSEFALVICESRGADDRPSLPLAVREQLGLSQTPLLVLTSWVHLDDELAAVAAGALAFIAKPCDYRKLLRCVDRVLRPEAPVGAAPEWSERLGPQLHSHLSGLPNFAC